MEVFRDIEKYEGLYQVTSFGRIYSVPRVDARGVKRGGRFLCLNNGRSGQKRIGLHKDNILTLHIVSHLVAKAFPEICGEWFEGCEVHHKNHNPSDNVAENIIVLTMDEHKKIHSESELTFNKRSSAQKKSYESGKRKPTHKGKAVRQYDIDGNFIAAFSSARDACKSTNTNASSLCSCLKGDYKTAGGYVWKYA